jgi:hypothetical protein
MRGTLHSDTGLRLDPQGELPTLIFGRTSFENDHRVHRRPFFGFAMWKGDRAQGA